MIIKVRLFAMLRDKLPPDAVDGEFTMELPAGSPARHIIEKLDIPEAMAHLVMVNGYHLLPDERDNRPLVDGEVVSIFPPVAGG